jgi:hypothetical protein
MTLYPRRENSSNYYTWHYIPGERTLQITIYNIISQERELFKLLYMALYPRR